LTRRAKQAHNDIIAKIVSPPRLTRGGFFFVVTQIAVAVWTQRTLFAAFSSNLTRRAKHLHTDIIRKVDRPAREIAAGFLFAKIRVRSILRRTALALPAVPALQFLAAKTPIDIVPVMFQAQISA